MKIKQFIGLLSLGGLVVNNTFAEFVSHQTVFYPGGGDRQSYKKIGDKYYINLELGGRYGTGNNAKYQLLENGELCFTFVGGGANEFSMDYSLIDIPIVEEGIKIKSYNLALGEPWITHGIVHKIQRNASSISLFGFENFLFLDIELEIDLNSKIFTGQPINTFKTSTLPFAKIQYTCHTPRGRSGELIIALGNLNITPPIEKTCTYTSNRNQVVNLRETSKNDLDRGEVLGGSFNLNLNCPTNSQIQRAYAVFTDQTTPSNNSNILTLTNNSTAKGVGLKIYPAGDSQAVKFSPVQSNVMDISQANRLKNYHSGGG